MAREKRKEVHLLFIDLNLMCFFFPFQKKKKKKEHYVLINPRGRQLTLVEQGLT